MGMIEMTKPVRVLQVLGGTALGGAESRIMDLYRNMDRTKLQFDFVVHNRNEDHYNEEIRSLGGKIYRIPKFRFYNILAYRSAWKRFFCEHTTYAAVHGHMTSTAAIYLPIAKRNGVPLTIAHARSAGTDPGIKGILTRWLRKHLYERADYCFACSKIAGDAVFGAENMRKGKIQIIPNAIEVDNYVYDGAVREHMREEYGLQNAYVIGHVGRFHYAKNHVFLLDIFAEISKKKENARLLLLGEGGLMPEIQEKAVNLGIQEKVIFAGSHTNVGDFYQAMDYLVFPSHFEGLPGTIVEAQAAGLRCLISDTIAKEVVVTELVETMSLQKSAKEWADYVLKNQTYDRQRNVTELKEAGFDVKSQVTKLQNFYLGKKNENEMYYYEQV